MAEVLDGCLHFVVSEEIDGISRGVELFVEVGLEWIDNQADLEVGVWCEDFGGVHLLHFEAPVVEDDHSVVEVSDVNVGELLLEFGERVFGEVALNEEVSICYQEVWVRLLHVALKWLLQILADLAEVTALVEYFCE